MRNRVFALWALPPTTANSPAPSSPPGLSAAHQRGVALLAAPHAGTGLVGPASPRTCSISQTRQRNQQKH